MNTRHGIPGYLKKIYSRYTSQVQFENYALDGQFNELSYPTDTARAFKNKRGLLVLVGIETHENQRWKHVSISYSHKLPSYDDLRLVKNIFIGIHETAIQVFPPQEEHVNMMPYCLHLFSPMDAKILPDFRTFFGLI